MTVPFRELSFYTVRGEGKPDGAFKRGIDAQSAAIWQATPGAIWYRRSMAEKYLGVSEPEDVQKLLSDMDSVYEAARTIKEKSGGSCYFICDALELWHLFNGTRTSPFVVDDQIVIDPAIEKFFEALKAYQSEGLILNVKSFGSEWFASMSDSLTTADGNTAEIFCYPSASWFLSFCIQPNMVKSDGSYSTSGDWAICEGPSFFFYGGTFYGINAASPELETIKEIFRYLSVDEEFLTDYCTTTGDFPASAVVSSKMAPDMSTPVLGGQNFYDVFNSISGKINEMFPDKYSDEAITNIMIDQAKEYAAGNKDMATAIADYQSALIGQYPDLRPAA